MPKISIDHHKMKSHNLSQILKLIWKEEDITRVELSKRLGLSRSSITAFTHQLIDQGMIEEARPQQSIGGRPPIGLRINPNRFQIIGVDMGSSHIQVISLSMTGTIYQSRYTTFDCCGDPEGTIEEICSLISQCLQKDIDLLGIGVAVPCPVFEHTLNERILPLWKGIDLRQRLMDSFQVPVFIDNDANLGALAEQWQGSEAEQEDFIFIKVATGVGAGVVSAGTIIRGSDGYAGEIGHIPIASTGLCRCGSIGCLEAHIGSQALRQAAMCTHSSLASGALPSIPLIIENAKKGEELAQRVLQEAANGLANAIGVLLNMFNPQRIILWGAVIEDNEPFLKYLRDVVSSSNHWSLISPSNIVPSTIGENVIAIGAGMLTLEKALNDPSIFTTTVPSKETICTN